MKSALAFLLLLAMIFYVNAQWGYYPYYGYGGYRPYYGYGGYYRPYTPLGGAIRGTITGGVLGALAG